MVQSIINGSANGQAQKGILIDARKTSLSASIREQLAAAFGGKFTVIEAKAKMNPKSPRGFKIRAAHYALEGNFPEAVADLEEAIRLAGEKNETVPPKWVPLLEQYNNAMVEANKDYILDPNKFPDEHADLKKMDVSFPILVPVGTSPEQRAAFVLFAVLVILDRIISLRYSEKKNVRGFSANNPVPPELMDLWNRLMALYEAIRDNKSTKAEAIEKALLQESEDNLRAFAAAKCAGSRWAVRILHRQQIAKLENIVQIILKPESILEDRRKPIQMCLGGIRKKAQLIGGPISPYYIREELWEVLIAATKEAKIPFETNIIDQNLIRLGLVNREDIIGYGEVYERNLIRSKFEDVQAILQKSKSFSNSKRIGTGPTSDTNTTQQRIGSTSLDGESEDKGVDSENGSAG